MVQFDLKIKDIDFVLLFITRLNDHININADIAIHSKSKFLYQKFTWIVKALKLSNTIKFLIMHHQ